MPPTLKCVADLLLARLGRTNASRSHGSSSSLVSGSLRK